MRKRTGQWYHMLRPWLIPAVTGFLLLPLAACTLEPPVPSPHQVAAVTGVAVRPAGGGEVVQAKEEPWPPPLTEGTVVIKLENFAISPGNVQVKAGDVEFQWENPSNNAHNYRIVRGNDPVNASDADVVYPGPKVGAKRTQIDTLTLEPGEYTVFCNLSDHLERGMRGRLLVVE